VESQLFYALFRRYVNFGFNQILCRNLDSILHCDDIINKQAIFRCQNFVRSLALKDSSDIRPDLAGLTEIK
jgi:hypothetical protein